jgi:hypothetical protein
MLISQYQLMFVVIIQLGFFDGDTEPKILFMHTNDHRRWRIAQTIERLSFNLCFWV